VGFFNGIKAGHAWLAGDGIKFTRLTNYVHTSPCQLILLSEFSPSTLHCLCPSLWWRP
jgi:hypothetical protein